MSARPRRVPRSAQPGRPSRRAPRSPGIPCPPQEPRARACPAASWACRSAARRCPPPRRINFNVELIHFRGRLQTVQRRCSQWQRLIHRMRPEYRRQMIELVRSGRSAGDLAREFGCCAQTIRNWVRQAERDEGRRDDGPTSSELEELRRLRRENRMHSVSTAFANRRD